MSANVTMRQPVGCMAFVVTETRERQMERVVERMADDNSERKEKR